MRSLLLVGHGSHLNPDSARAVYRYGELVRATRAFDEVVEAFWKEEPSLRQGLETVRGSDVTVIPVFISSGYFTETVIPREMGLGHSGPVPAGGATARVGGRTVHYTRPLGAHPLMEEIILARAREAVLAGLGTGADRRLAEAALVIIGHGTTGNRNSSRVVLDNADRLRARGVFAEVSALFLDEEPKLSGWPSATSAALVVMVPFFTAEGWHTQQTIPDELGLGGAVSRIGGRTVLYAPPVGTHPWVAEVIGRLANEAAGRERAAVSPPDEAHRAAWARFVALAHEGATVGEALVKPVAPGLFELRSALDRGRDDLETLVTPDGVRDRVRLTDGGEYRPVHTMRDLPRGWRAVLAPADLERATHALYPAAVEEAHAFEGGRLAVTPWAATARRQSGIYARVQEASDEAVAGVGRTLCSRCLKTRLWAGEELAKTFLSGAAGGIPCPEACTLFVSAVRDRVGGGER